jgi:hypothetical protein
MAIPSAIQFGTSVRQFVLQGNSVSAIHFARQFSSAIQFGNSVWQFGLAIRFGKSAIRFVKSIWQNEFNLTIRQFSSANQFGILV